MKNRPRFGNAIKAARKSLRESQDTFGHRFGVCRQTVGRWEVTTTMPAPETRSIVITGVGKLPATHTLAILASMGFDAPTTPTPTPNATPTPSATPTPTSTSPHVRTAIDLITYRLAERLDVGARGVRAAFASASPKWSATASRSRPHAPRWPTRKSPRPDHTEDHALPARTLA